MRDIKFSTVYPKYHPRAGQPTHFVEKIWAAVPEEKIVPIEYMKPFLRWASIEGHNGLKEIIGKHKPKRTTIRAGHRWKKGDLFVPKIWTGKPYRSTPIAICEPLEILETEAFNRYEGVFYLDGKELSPYGQLIKDISLTDGFDDHRDFIDWFYQPPSYQRTSFEGQRIRFA